MTDGHHHNTQAVADEIMYTPLSLHRSISTMHIALKICFDYCHASRCGRYMLPHGTKFAVVGVCMTQLQTPPIGRLSMGTDMQLFIISKAWSYSTDAAQLHVAIHVEYDT